MTTTYDKVIQLANTLQAEGKYDSTYSAVLAIYQELTGDTETKFDSTYSIVATIADGVESGDISIGGGGDEEVKDYNTHKFYNANGELVEEWTLEETQSKTELPTLGGIGFSGWTLNFDGWNWDLEQLKSASCGQNIGAMYRPSDNKTHIIVDIAPENLTYVLFVQMLEGFEIDWGDGVIEDVDTINGFPQHTYTTAGSKEIKITGNWLPQWGVAPSDTQTWEGFPGWYYGSRVKSVISGNKLGMLNFGYCTGLEYLTFTGDIHVYDSSFYKFYNIKSLKYLALPKGITDYPESNSIEVISMPYGVTSINNRKFEYCPALINVNIPDSVTSIGMLAFYGCKALQFVNIPNSVTNIGSDVFYQCITLQYITMSNNITSIGSKMFYECQTLRYVNIPNGVTSIGKDAFYNCYLLKSINIPDTVTSIGDNAFYECYSLQSVNIPNGVTSIGSSAFNYCKSLTSITIPDSVTYIGSSVFSGCTELTSITIPNSITSIYNSVFSDCCSLQSVYIPDSVTGGIGSYVFNNCYALQSVNLPEGITKINNNLFYYCNSLKSVNIPSSVTSIGDKAFYGCNSLPYIKIPNSVTSIGSSVFTNDNYITVDFSNCIQVPELASTNSFKWNHIILVPSSLYDEWIASTNWSSLTSQIIAV